MKWIQLSVNRAISSSQQSTLHPSGSGSRTEWGLVFIWPISSTWLWIVYKFSIIHIKDDLHISWLIFVFSLIQHNTIHFLVDYLCINFKCLCYCYWCSYTYTPKTTSSTQQKAETWPQALELPATWWERGWKSSNQCLFIYWLQKCQKAKPKLSGQFSWEKLTFPWILCVKEALMDWITQSLRSVFN